MTGFHNSVHIFPITEIIDICSVSEIVILSLIKAIKYAVLYLLSFCLLLFIFCFKSKSVLYIIDGWLVHDF